MNILVLNTEFEQVAIIDSYQSLIWTDRYYGYGDFELYLPFNSSILNTIYQDYYLQIPDSRSTMIVESIRIDTSFDSGNYIIVTGRSLESILERRIIWPEIELPEIKTKAKGTIYEAMKTLISDAIINPTASRFKDPTFIKRRIDNFIFEDCEDISITSIPLESTTFNGEVLYDVILDWCQNNEIGFDITFEDVYDHGGQITYNQFVMRLYRGEDRSYEQDYNDWVIFSPSYDNVISTNYIDDISPWRNFAIVSKENDEAKPALMYGDVEKRGGSYVTTGLNHRELYVDARDIQESDLPEGLSYKQALIARGAEKLNEALKDIEFTGEVEAERQFKYGVDFFMGDIVEITNEYGIKGAARVIEYIHNDTDSGHEVYPTFEAIQDYGYDSEDV